MHGRPLVPLRLACHVGPAIALVALFSLLTSPRAADRTIRLVDVAEQSGLTLLNVHGGSSKDYILDTNGNGAALFDYDNDDDLDVAIVNGSTREHLKQGGNRVLALYRNDGKGRFQDVTAGSGLLARGWGMGTCVADVDNDGFKDIYVTAFGPNVLYHNNGNGTFTDATKRAGVGDSHWGTGCAFGDYDRDGFVDLYVANYVAFDERTVPKRGSSDCNYLGISVMCGPRGLQGEADVLYHNNGNGTFTDVTKAAGIKDPDLYGFGVLFSDLNNDGWPDIVVANDSVPNLMFRNLGNGTFVEEGLLSGVGLSGDGRPQAGMGIDAGDYDGDGNLDLIVTHFSEDYHTLYENGGRGLFADVSHRAGIALPPLRYLGWGVGFVDLDNDGLLDLFVANGHVYPEIDRSGQGSRYLQRKQLFRNLGTKRFLEIGQEVGGGVTIEKASRGAAFGDVDNDGDIDILVINMNDRPTLLRNDTAPGNHWVTFRLTGTKSNRDAIGARVQIEAGGRKQIAEVRSGGSYLSHNDVRAHFGLGDVGKIDRVEIRWPSGRVDAAAGPAVDTFYVAKEGEGLRQVRPR